ANLIWRTLVPRKIAPKYDIDPVQRVWPFMFSEEQKERLFKELAPVKVDQTDIIAQLERCAGDYYWLQKQYREKPTRAEQNAALNEIGQFAREHGLGLRRLAKRLRGLDKDTEWELMLSLGEFYSESPMGPIATLADQLENFVRAAE